MNNDIMSKSVFPKHTYYHVNVCWEKMVGENGEEWSEPRHSYEFIDRCDLQMVLRSIYADGVFNEMTGSELKEIANYFGKCNYEGIVSGLVSARYTDDEMTAIQNNFLEALSEGKEPDAEFKEMQEWRADCKERAKRILNLTNV